MKVWVAVGAFFILLGVMVFLEQRNQVPKNYYSVQMRRMPCGRVLQREVEERNGGWIKRVRLLSPEGRVLEEKVRTIEPEHCQAIQAGQFVPNLWGDCVISLSLSKLKS
jgi:hypothetical protein